MPVVGLQPALEVSAWSAAVVGLGAVVALTSVVFLVKTVRDTLRTSRR